MEQFALATLVIAAVAATIHCGPAEPTVETELSEPAAEVPHARWAARWVAEPERWPVMELGGSLAEHGTLERFETDAGSSVTSTASAADGTRYVAGIFSGVLRVGSTALSSRGGDDVFLARLRPDGGIAWARAVGSKGRESGAKVDFEDGRVKLLAMTDGAVDCGRGPLKTWSSEAFFLCTFGPDGEPIDGASFPTGRP